MFFNFDSTRTLVNTDEVYNCLNTWSQETKSIICKKEEVTPVLAKEVSAFSLTILEDDSSSTIQVREATATHTYQKIKEKTSFGCSELSKHYNLEIKGKKDNGEDFTFTAYLSRDSEDRGRSWSTPFERFSLS